MARIVLGSYMVRYPLGGMMSWVLQYLVGFHRLGHDVFFVEKAGFANSCFDPSTNTMGDDCSYGTAVVGALLSRFGLAGKWCYVDAGRRYHGLERTQIEEVIRTADVFVDMGTHGAWLPEAARGACSTVLIDGEPGFTQMKIQKRLDNGESVPHYKWHFSTGRNIGTAASTAPAGGRSWYPIFHPVVIDLFGAEPSATAGAPFTTVMNWQSYEPLVFRGITYGHKDVEFGKFIDLPRRAGAGAPMEIAVAGKAVPKAALAEHGWRIRSAHDVTHTFDSFVGYIRDSAGEFSICKSGYVVTNTGWFSDRSAVYLACGRPVVMQDTGFGSHLPCGQGLFAVRTVDEAADAIRRICKDYNTHSKAARRVAQDYLSTAVVLPRFLDQIGVG